MTSQKNRLPDKLSPQEFNALSQSERLERVRQARGRRRYDLLIDASDVYELVSKIPAQELYLLARELGPEDCTELVGMLTPHQFEAFLDLEAWPDDLFDDKAVMTWLARLWESGPERVWEVLFLSRQVTVSGGLSDLLEEDSLQTGETDQVYRVAYVDEQAAKLVGPVLEMAFQQDQSFYLGLMESIRQEGGAEHEEATLRLRAGRLADLGFPTWEEALQIYAWRDPDAVAGGKQPGSLATPPLPPDGALVAAVRPGTLLAAALAGGMPAELGWELTYLTNKVLVANRLDVGESSALLAAVDEVCARLELALAYRCGADAEAARSLLLSSWLVDLFRIGFSLTLRLQRRANPLRRSPAGRRLDPPFLAVVEALGRPRPLFLDEMGIAEPGPGRLFRTLAELESAGEWLSRIEAQVKLFDGVLPFGAEAAEAIDLTGCNPAEASEVTLSELFLTALAQRLLGGTFAPEPLAEGEVRELRRRITREGGLDPELLRETEAWLESAVPAGGMFARFTLSLWDESLCCIAESDLDLRALSGLIVRLA